MTNQQPPKPDKSLATILKRPYIWAFLGLVVLIFVVKIAVRRQGPDPSWIKDPSPAAVKQMTLTVLQKNPEIDRIADRYSFNLIANSDVEVADMEEMAKAKGFQYESVVNQLNGDTGCLITAEVPKKSADLDKIYEEVSQITSAHHDYLASVVPLAPKGADVPPLKS